MTKAKKIPVPFLVDGYEPETNTAYHFHGCHWHGNRHPKESYKNTTKEI